jgi:glycosyltransferase involved in cell wall biosynthesis
MKISVLTPSYNSGIYLERAIQSVINQRYKNYEHIVCDGGSNDNTVEVLKKYPQINYVSEPDKGQSDAMNKAFNMSTGEIIVYLNADDEFAPNAFEHIIQAFERDRSIDMVVGNLIFLSPEEKLIRSPSSKYLDILLYWKNLFPNNPVSYFYKREVQIGTGDFPIDNHYSMDMWFLLKAYRKFNIFKVNEILGTFHSDGTNKTAVVDTGIMLHSTVKNHLKQHTMLLLYFYFKLAISKFTNFP